MKNDNIKLSPKYGVNPTINTCFFCQKPKDEIILLGRIKDKTNDDIEAPKYSILNYEPCPDCLEKMKQGCLLISVLTTPKIEGMPPIRHNNETKLYPTGDWCVIKEDAYKKIFNSDPVESDNGLKCSFIEKELYDAIINHN